jgi:uncharacterized glyoxalase superfamily protein PhnB
VTVHRVTPILNVADVSASIAWFEQLGWECSLEWSDEQGAELGFGGVSNGAGEIFLCRGAQGSQGTRPSAGPFDEGTGGVWMSWFLGSVAEVDALHARAVQLGLDVAMEPTDEPWGIREFHLRHPDGHTFRVGAHRG